MTPRADTDRAQRVDDLKAAGRMIGSEPAQQLAWLTEFVRQDPATWPSGTRSTMGECLLALSWRFPSSLVSHDNVPAPMDGATVVRLHGELAEVLNALVNSPVGTVIKLPASGVIPAIMRATAVGQKPAAFSAADGVKTARDGVFNALRRLLLECGQSLISCPVCRRPFVATGKRLFCSPACSQRARDDRRPKDSREHGKSSRKK